MTRFGEKVAAVYHRRFAIQTHTHWTHFTNNPVRPVFRAGAVFRDIASILSLVTRFYYTRTPETKYRVLMDVNCV